MDTQPVQTETISATLSASTGYGGSFTLSYPDGKGATDFASAARSILRCNSKNELHESRSQYSVVYGASNITVTILTNQSYNLGEVVHLDVDIGALRQGGGMIPAIALASASKMDSMQVVKINLGAPDTADVDGLLESYTGSAPALDGALVSSGVGTFDVPRNIVIDSGGVDTAVLTFTGTDEFGATVVESITLNGTTAVAGKKAFKTVTGVTSSAAIANGAFAGPGDVLGLPCYLADKADLFIEAEDGAAPTAGTVVAGVTTTATATTGDVRGTYDPNSACDGSAVFELTMSVRDPSYKGVTQYSG